MRAIGVILVIFEHCGGKHFKWLSGWLGVHIFFVMSGFLITTLLLREQGKNGRVSLRDFYLRRIFRIFPVYYLILTVTIAQTHALGGESWIQLKHALPYYVTFLNEQHFVAPWKITWTMGIEWKFYLVWPALAFILPLGHKLCVCGHPHSAAGLVVALG
jgi:peptidoglycan/LPS O-acetylase OafA/YrhL